MVECNTRRDVVLFQAALRTEVRQEGGNMSAGIMAAAERLSLWCS